MCGFNMYTITKALPEQLSVVHEIVHMTVRAIYPHYYPGGAVAFFIAFHNEEKIAADIRAEKVWLLSEGGVYMGTVTVNGNEIARLFVLPEHQGKGCGSALMNFCEKIVFDRYDCAELHASFPAYRMYEKRGYRPEIYHRALCENGDYLCIHEMRLRKEDRLNYDRSDQPEQS